MNEKGKLFQSKDAFKNQKAITLIALVISIIVMLILAGVSLNATIGENGIMAQAKNATYVQSVAVLEEYLNNYYVQHYEDMQEDESKVLTLTKLETEWFYIPANEGVGGLRYIVDGEGHALYLIKKSGLPEEIKSQVRGGDAGEGKYADYVALNDVYGVTSDLKVYYCSNGTDTILGESKETLDSDNPLRQVFTESNNSAIYGLLSDYDVANRDGEKDGILTAEELKSVTKLTIDSSSGIIDFSSLYNLISLKELTFDGVTLSNLSGIENCPQLNYVYFKSSVIADYSNLVRVKKLKYLYLYDIDDNELETLCNGIKDAEFGNLEYLAITGNNYSISQVDVITPLYINSNKSPKKITNLQPLELLTDTTKKAVKYLSINNNNIESLEPIKDFTNTILLRCEYNQLTNLNGLENMQNLMYLCGVGNKLGMVTKEDGTIVNEDVETGNSIQSLSNKNKLQKANLNSNTNLANVSYFSNDTAIKYLYLDNCNKNMNVNVIANILNLCSPNYVIPVKFLTGSIYNVSAYYTPSNVTYDELYSDLYGNSTITHLNLEGCSKLTNEQLNTILGSMPQLKYLTLKDCTQLTSIDFVAESHKTVNADETNSYTYTNSKCTNLIELDLRGTNVLDMTPLNEYAKSLGTLRVSNGSDFKNIAKAISRLNGYRYWYSNQEGNSGLVCSTIEVYKELESVTDLENLKTTQYSVPIGNSNTVIDLTNTKLKKVGLSGVLAYIKLPNTVESFSQAGAPVPVIAENSDKLTNISISNIGRSEMWKNGFFTTLKNATSLNNLCLERMAEINFTKINDYINYEMPSVKYLTLSGANSSIIKSLDGIEYFPNIETLQVWNNNVILNISAINSCKQLKYVDISNCKVQNLSGLEGLNSIHTLNLSNNNISNLKPLENLINLEYLNLNNNAISDTASYTDNTGATKTYNNLDLLAKLNKTGKLKKLYLSGNDNIVNWTPLSSLNWIEKSGW